MQVCALVNFLPVKLLYVCGFTVFDHKHTHTLSVCGLLLAGDFVVVDPIVEGNKVKGEIVHILYPEQIRYLRERKLWLVCVCPCVLVMCVCGVPKKCYERTPSAGQMPLQKQRNQRSGKTVEQSKLDFALFLWSIESAAWLCFG